MSKVFRTVGLLVLVAAFVFSFSSVSKAVPPIPADGETCTITTFTDIYCAGSVSDPTCTATETESYSFEKVRLPFPFDDKIKVLYEQTLTAVDGETRVVKEFESNTEGDLTTPNLDVAMTVTFGGYTGGSIDAEEKVGLMRSTPLQYIVGGYCGIWNFIQPSCLDAAMGSSYTASSIKAVTGSEISGAVISIEDLVEGVAPMIEHKITAEGIDPDLSPYAVGTVRAGMAVMVLEDVTTGPVPPGGSVSTETYEEHASASGLVKLTKEMKYQSKYTAVVGVPSAFTKVP